MATRLLSSIKNPVIWPILLISISSFLRFWGAESHIIDLHFPPIAIGLICITLFLIGAAWLSVLSYENFRDNRKISLMQSAFLLLPILIAPPSTSNDLQVYMYQGAFLQNQLDPYKDIQLIEREKNPFFKIVSNQYKEIHSKYGPVWIGISAATSKMGSFFGMYLFKILNYVILLFLIGYSKKINERFTWLWLSAIPIIEIVGQGHNDLLSVAICFLLFMGYSEKNGFKNGLLALLIPLTKMIYFPFMFLNLLNLLKSDRKSFYLSLLIQVAGLVGWYFIHPYSLLSSFKTGVSMRPSGSWADVFYEIGNAFLNGSFHANFYSEIFQCIGLVVFCVVGILAIRKRGLNMHVGSSLLILGCIVYFSIFIPRLFPWYLLFFIPLFQQLNPKQKSVFFILSFFGVMQGSMHFFNPENQFIRVPLITTSTFLTLICLLYMLQMHIKAELTN